MILTSFFQLVLSKVSHDVTPFSVTARSPLEVDFDPALDVIKV
jgi:hypothetical protein